MDDSEPPVEPLSYAEFEAAADAEWARLTADLEAGRERIPEEWEVEGPAVSLSLGDACDLDPALLAAITGPDGLGGQALSPAFGQDAAADALRPGPVLAALTEQAIAGIGLLSDDELTGALQAARRLGNRAAYLQTVAVAEFARRRAAQFEDAKARKVPLGRRPGEFPGEELAMELVVSRELRGPADRARPRAHRPPPEHPGRDGRRADQRRPRRRDRRAAPPACPTLTRPTPTRSWPPLAPGAAGRPAGPQGRRAGDEAQPRGRQGPQGARQAGPAAGRGPPRVVRQRLHRRPRARHRRRAGLQGLHRRARRPDPQLRPLDATLPAIRARVMTELLQGRNPLDLIKPRPRTSLRTPNPGPDSRRPADPAPTRSRRRTATGAPPPTAEGRRRWRTGDGARGASNRGEAPDAHGDAGFPDPDDPGPDYPGDT